jgi:AcrR family transcriptional regulator
VRAHCIDHAGDACRRCAAPIGGARTRGSARPRPGGGCRAVDDGVYTHFGSKQGLLEELYLYGFRRLEERLSSVPSDGQGRQELLAFALAYRAFALDNDALYGLMFERATPDFVPSDASRLAALSTFEMLATRVADWRPDFTDPAADAHLVWATMHGLVTIELMLRRWGGPLVAHLQGDPKQNYATAIGSLLDGRSAENDGRSR